MPGPILCPCALTPFMPCPRALPLYPVPVLYPSAMLLCPAHITCPCALPCALFMCSAPMPCPTLRSALCPAEFNLNYKKTINKIVQKIAKTHFWYENVCFSSILVIEELMFWA